MKPGEHIAAGDLNLLIALYAPVRNESGDEITGEELIASGIPASKRTLRAREVEASGRDVADVYAVFTIRFRPGLDNLAALTHGGDRWAIEYPDNINGANRRIDILARLVR